MNGSPRHPDFPNVFLLQKSHSIDATSVGFSPKIPPRSPRRDRFNRSMSFEPEVLGHNLVRSRKFKNHHVYCILIMLLTWRRLKCSTPPLKNSSYVVSITAFSKFESRLQLIPQIREAALYWKLLWSLAVQRVVCLEEIVLTCSCDCDDVELNLLSCFSVGTLSEPR